METITYNKNDSELHAARVWDNLESSQLSLLASFDNALNQTSGIGYLWFRVLDALAQSEGGLRLQDLADRVFHSQSGTTRLVDRLVQEGLVERHNCDSDRRVTYARLTLTGAERHQKIKQIWEKLLENHFWNALDPQDQSDLARICKKLLVNGSKPVCLSSLIE
jgi:DNA-binding MarR family transcriptional regulator